MIPIAPSSEAWVEAACADLPTLLLDHAHCEKKAASTAIRFMSRYPDWPRLVSAMSKLAREELLHFDQVRRELESRGVPFRGLPSANYAAELFACARPQALGPSGAAGGAERSGKNGRVVDEMLCCALIEARSHERFERLAAAVPDPRLATFYADLAEAEARHGTLYVELAQEAATSDVSARLADLAAREAEIVTRPNQPLRMHAGG